MTRQTTIEQPENHLYTYSELSFNATVQTLSQLAHLNQIGKFSYSPNSTTVLPGVWYDRQAKRPQIKKETFCWELWLCPIH